MKIGYACLNTSVGCTSSKTLRLSSYAPVRLEEIIKNNLECLKAILEYNVQNNLLLFRITSALIPFGSHPLNTYPWQEVFQTEFQKIGLYAKKNGLRLTLHPGQFTILNSPLENVVDSSLKELEYHVQILDLMDLDAANKIQIHLGGAYGDKNKSLERFVSVYSNLSDDIKRRLVIENDERIFNFPDCFEVSQKTGIPVVFDHFHHRLNNNGESTYEALKLANSTWQPKDGLLIVDYSDQDPKKKRGAHAAGIDPAHFQDFLAQSREIDFDLMIESKDKEKSALEALRIAREAKPSLLANSGQAS